jgi:hypothetical protein
VLTLPDGRQAVPELRLLFRVLLCEVVPLVGMSSNQWYELGITTS